jgi:hypothetical protein
MILLKRAKLERRVRARKVGATMVLVDARMNRRRSKVCRRNELYESGHITYFAGIIFFLYG